MDSHSTSPLHLSQKMFWFAASFSLFIGSLIFCWRLVQNTNASVKLFGIEISCEAAQKSVQETKESLVAFRTRLQDASEQQNLDSMQRILPELGEILKTLGVAESSLKSQRRLTGELTTSYGYTDYVTGSYDTGSSIYNYELKKKTAPAPKKKDKQ